nr:uncharacterized protein LOC129430035 isoform X1 [Misgurnus anguillicaudatus]XP_055043015.1 uncharacterized protein LOC129430035 isoform X1 [Misgurnus anguillicaudatus]
MKQWCIVQFQNGGTEIVPHCWLMGERLLWPPYPPKDTAKVRAAVKKYEQPTEGWLTYEPIRHLLSRATYEEAEKSLKRYLKENCDTTDMQSDGEMEKFEKRKSKPNPVYNKPSDTEGEVKKRKLLSAPRIRFPVPTKVLTAVDPASRVQTSVQPFTKFLPIHSMESSDQMCSSSQYLTESNDSPPLPSLYSRQESSFSDGEDARDSARLNESLLMKDVALQKLIGTVTELVKEVKELREECQDFFRQSLPTSKQPMPALPVSLPLHNNEELDSAEDILQSSEARQIMVRRFSIIGGTSLEVRVRRMLSCALTNELASSINWAGKMVKGQSKQKRAFKDTFLNVCIFDALSVQMGVGKVSQFDYNQAVQKWLRYAPYRVGGTAHKTAATTPHLPPETT